MKRLAILAAVVMVVAAGALAVLVYKPFVRASRIIGASEDASHRGMMRNAVIAAEAPSRPGQATFTDRIVAGGITPEMRTLKRLVQNVVLPVALDARYSDDTILTAYMDRVYLGRDVYGVTAAARVYFGKKLEQLTPAECALIAAMIRSPHYYSPFRNPQHALRRRNHVLETMRQRGFISDAAYENAVDDPLPVTSP